MADQENAPPTKSNAPVARLNMGAMLGQAGNTMRRGDIIFAMGIIGILTVLVFPVPPMLLDLLLGTSITLSILILMVVLFVQKPLDLSSFPTILLVATLLRLALNIATTRLILAHGHEGTDAAGGVIEAFSGFITGGSVLIGAIILAF